MDARPRVPRRFPALGAGLMLAIVGLGGEASVMAQSGGPPPAARRRAEQPGERARGLSSSARPGVRAAPSARPPALSPPGATSPADSRAFLIYLIDGGEPIVVDGYREEEGHVVFEKYGGWVRIPTYEILKIVPDEPDPSANLPTAPVVTDTAGAPLLPESDLYVTMRGGGNLKVAGLTPEGDRVRVTVPNGAFTVPRSEILGVVRVPPGADLPEAWLSVLATDRTEDEATVESAGLVPATPDPRLPYQSSDHPHVLRLANGQRMRIEAFWVEDGEFRFRRLGGMVGLALSEVMRLIPEEIAPVRGRTPVRFARRLGPDLLEVRVRSGYHRVRLLGVTSVDGMRVPDSPWRLLERGTIVYLEFDRQRYDAAGNWLAYVFLPSGRMLQAELVRLGLARPFADGRNVRYLDLFHELADGGTVAAGAGGPDRD